jgi:uncharacterized protein YdgA (DUF945 family)
MAKTVISGSMLAKLLPGVAKFFLANADQDDVLAAEQEAAVLHAQLEALEPKRVSKLAGPSTPSSGNEEVASLPVDAPDMASIRAEHHSVLAQLQEQSELAATATATVAELTATLATVQAERDSYKVWYDKQAGKGLTKPGADASVRGTEEAGQQPVRSAASAAALREFLARQGR